MGNNEITHKARHSGVEFLRCIMMFLVVLGHARHFGFYSAECLPLWTYFFFGVFISWHVDCFVSISGWFGIKFSWLKFLKIFGVCAYAKVLSIIFAKVIAPRVGVDASQLAPEGGWFAGTYCMLMFVAPLINAAVKALVDESSKALISAWGLFAIAMTLDWAPIINKFVLVHPQGGGRFRF